MKTIKLLLCTLTLLLMQLNATAGGTNVYKWKDKNGVIHYSQTAPQGQEVQVITTKTPREPLPDEESGANLDAVAEEDTASGDMQATSDAPKPAAPAVAKKDQATCDMATKAVSDLQKPVIMNQGKIMSIEEKNIEIQKMQEIIKVHCP